MDEPSKAEQDATIPSPPDRRRAVIGNASNFWLHSSKHGFDLTHPPHPSSPPSSPRLRLATTTTPITISPAKTALVVIDMQNFFLSEAFGRNRGKGHDACDRLVEFAVPAARRAGIQVVWLNWGLDDQDIRDMPPAVKRAFGFEAIVEDEGDADATDAAVVFADGADGNAAPPVDERTGEHDAFAMQPGGVGVDKMGELAHRGGKEMLENGKDARIYKGLGSPCGTVTLPSGGTVDAGRLLVRDTWNAALYPPLEKLYLEGKMLERKPDVWIHKDRMSGLWRDSTPCIEFLEKEGIRTLLFAGVNTDQCVSGSVTDAFCKGYDCVLLKDGCGTTSPEFAREGVEFNAARTWGFVSGCEELAKGVEEMQSK